MDQLRTYLCPDCLDGWVEVNRSHDPACAVDVKCSECEGTGRLVMDRYDAHDRGLTRAPLKPTPDLLETVATLRTLQRRGPRLALAYGATLQLAVSPVNLPDLRA